MTRSISTLRFIPSLFLLLLSGACSEPASDIRITDAWARETPAGAVNGAIYMVIENAGEGRDRLVEIATPGAATAHLHEMRREGGMARMRGLGTLEIPPHGRIELAPGGLHIMLMGLTQPLKAGETLPLHLRFLKAGERDIAVAIRSMDGA